MTALARIRTRLASGLLRAMAHPLHLTLAYATRKGRHARRNARHWERRHRDVAGCPDNDRIPRVPDAGRLVGDVQVMHNGLKIRAGSYYGSEVTRMLEANRGVHEPQEEWVFQEVLRHVRPDGVMLELGAYWGFYSMWFLTRAPRGRAILVEPEAENLAMGRANFEINGLAGEFLQALVGSSPGVDGQGRRTVSVDELVGSRGLDRIDILHSDIQGFEVQMLEGARETLQRRLVDYIFISTHGQELHGRCRACLCDHGFEIIADAGMRDTYSYDGLLAARRADLPGLGPVPISLKTVAGLRRRRAGAPGAG